MNVALFNHGRGPGRRKIAVVGSGISGAAAAWALNATADVTLFEAEARARAAIPQPSMSTMTARRIAVDTGFIVYNELNYPDLTALFAHLGVATHESDMGFSLSLDGGRLEWSGCELSARSSRRSAISSRRPSCGCCARSCASTANASPTATPAQLAHRSIGDYLEAPQILRRLSATTI